MPSHYLRVDAVNFDQFVYDTHDISTIRGGSFLLLETIKNLEEEFKFKEEQVISTASSQGLFALTMENQKELDKLQRDMLDYLNKKTGKGATFVIAVEEDVPDDFPLVLRRLDAQIRRKQWRYPTVAIPDLAVETETECFLNGWRPGTNPYRVDPQVTGAKISNSAKFRRSQGRVLKHKIFNRLLDEEFFNESEEDQDFNDILCAKDLGELAKDPRMGNLDGRIAFIHIDGNSFGAFREDKCDKPERYKKFTEILQGKFRNKFLKELILRADKDEHFKAKDENGREALRLEVLLWGGDELTVIVPAWKGWEVITLFYDMARKLEVFDTELSHRTALIFCQHNTPILQVRKLADDLHYQAKADIKHQVNEISANREEALPEAILKRQASHELCDALHYLNLISFDMLQGSLAGFLKTYYKNVAYHNLLIRAHELPALWEKMRVIRQHVAREKVFQIIGVIQEEGSVEDRRYLIGQVGEQALHVLPLQQKMEVKKILEEVGDAFWYMVADLWDFLNREEVYAHVSS